MLSHAGYKLATAQGFLDACSSQGVDLDPNLRSAIPEGSKRPARELVVAAGGVLRVFGAGMPLADRVIERPILPADNVCAILTTIINASIEPVTPSPPSVCFARHAPWSVNSCASAESGFALTLNQIKQGAPTRSSSWSYGGEIFVDDEGKAFALRKSEGYSSALALEDVSIGGIPFPRGSLLYIDTPEHRQGYHALPSDEFRVRPARDIVGIGFTRLTGFASSPEQREVDRYARDEVGDVAYHLLTTIGGEVLQPLVQTVVDSLRN